MIMEDHIMEDSPVETDQQDDVYLDLAMTTTDTIKKALWTLKTSQRVKIHVSWIKKVKLSSDEYHQFVLLLNEDKENHTKEKSRYVKHYLVFLLTNDFRYNYRPHLSQLTIKLSGMVHDIFTSELCSAISNWVEWIATTSPEPMASIFERVAFKGCSEIKKLRLGSYFGTQDPNSSALVKHSPDAAFWMGGSSYPTIVIESFYYNDPATMAELAREYIVGSNGHIKVVVGFDLFESEEKQSPTVSVWRGKVTRTSNGMQRLEFSQTVIEKVNYILGTYHYQH